MPEPYYYVDTDNALGSARGDIDDAFAMSALFSKPLQWLAVGSVFGNTSSEAAFQNTETILPFFNHSPQLLWRGADSAGQRDNQVSQSLAQFLFNDQSDPSILNLLALGPLTNIAGLIDKCSAEQISRLRLVCLGSDTESYGQIPPYWPFEFNFSKDVASTQSVFQSGLDITVVPLNQARRLRLRYRDLAKLSGVWGQHFQEHSKRWFWRARLLKWRNDVPLWDLLLAMWVIRPDLFECQRMNVSCDTRAWINYRAQDQKRSKSITVIKDFDPREIWQAYLSLF